MPKRIGIMGGTFNPIHEGHIKIAKRALKDFDLDKVIFVPSGTPPHKTAEKVEDKEHRYNMVKLAIKETPGFFASRIELDRKGYSFAVDTFKELKNAYGKTAQLYYIMGLDSINEILSWKKPLELFKMCEFIVATRPNAKIRTYRRLMKFPPLADQINKIHLIELKIDLSSTEIRKKLRAGKPVKGHVPKLVLDYIKENKLYEN